jgi:hypothetical protein
MKWLAYALLISSAPLALQQRVAAAYENGTVEISELAKSELRGDIRTRVNDLEPVAEIILDYWRADLTDGGSALGVLYLEYQLPDGSGAVEVFDRGGSLIVRGHFDEFNSLTWEFH